MRNNLLLAVSVSALIGLPDLRLRAEAVEFTRIRLEQTASHSCGCAWGDYDNDGFPDLFVTTSSWWSTRTPCVLYRNNRDGTFTRVPPAEAGDIVGIDRPGHLDACDHPHERRPHPRVP